MNRKIMPLALAVVIGASAPVSAQGIRQFMSRLSPARIFDRVPDDDERPRMPPSLDELRERLEEQGLDEEEITRRLERINEIRERRRERMENREDGERPDFVRLRAKLEERGIDTAALDERIARIQQARATRSRPPFAGRDRDQDSNDNIDVDRIRTRLEGRGLDAAEID